MAESRGNTLATNRNNSDGSTDRGLMQVNSVHRDMVPSLDVLYQPEVNMRVAHQLWLAHGWQPWVTYITGSYKQFL